jgi:two-component system chemotaxis response regulator CheY
MREISALIVDDSSVMRGILERALRQAGLTIAGIFQASNGLEALEVLREQRVDVIFSDINMPHMGGLELLRELRARKLASGVPVVMVTTEGGQEHVLEAIAAGAQGYIRKPVTAAQVKERELPLIGA